MIPGYTRGGNHITGVESLTGAGSHIGVGILKGTNCAPLLANLFLYSCVAEFIQKLHKKKKSLAVASI